MDMAIRSSISPLPNAHTPFPVDRSTKQWSQNSVSEVRVTCCLGNIISAKIIALPNITSCDSVFSVKCVDSTDNGSAGGGGGIGGNGRFSSGGGGGDDGEESDYEEEEFGPVMRFEDVVRETERRGTSLPSDMLDAAKTIGLRGLVLSRYLDLQVDVCYICVL